MYEYNAKVVRWKDGDTAVLDVDCGFNCHFIETFRVARINAPALSTVEGIAATEFAAQLLPIGTNVMIHSSKRETPIKEEKYGRWLAEIILPDGTNFGDKMLENGMAILWH